MIKEIYLPNNLYIDTDLPFKGRWKYLYVINEIMLKSKYDATSFNGYVNLHSKLLQLYLGTRNTVLSDLEAMGMIEINHSYEVGQSSKSYRLTEKYRNAVPVKIKYDFPTKFQNKQLELRKNQQCGDKVLQQMECNIMKVDIDKKSALKLIDELEVNSKGEPITEIGKFWYRDAVEKIDAKDIFITRDKNGRIHHNLTNLPKVLRQFLSVDGIPLEEIDIANSQLVLFIKYLREYVKEVFNPKSWFDIPGDVLLYETLCLNGTFYEHIMREYDIPIENRGKFKVDFFAKVFFSTGKVDYVEAQKFRKSFPTVSEAIKHAKRLNYKDLPNKLQKLEAEIVTEIECSDFWYTVHDCIVGEKGKSETKAQLLMNRFEKVMNIRPTLKTKIVGE